MFNGNEKGNNNYKVNQSGYKSSGIEVLDDFEEGNNSLIEVLDEVDRTEDSKTDVLNFGEKNSNDDARTVGIDYFSRGNNGSFDRVGSLEKDRLKSEENIVRKSDVADSSSQSNKKKFKKKCYISFEARVGVSIVFIFVLFAWSCILIFQALNFGKKEIVTYSETSKVKYNVCVIGEDYFSNNCLDEGREYISSIVDKVTANFKYNVDFSTDINYDLSYHVAAVTRVYDSSNNKKILYENEDLLIRKTEITGNNKHISLDKDIDIDFKERNDFVIGYKNKFALSSSASIEIILYLDEPNETRKVSSILIPLGNQTFGVTTHSISNEDKSVEIDNNIWNQYNTTCAIVGSLLIIVALLILFRLTRLVLKVTSNRNEYQTKLETILRNYDRIIVIARNGFVTTREKAITKVDNFDELLDAKNALNKPIIYSRINSVKSEFIVEDDDRIYKYVMKESDFSD